MASALFRREIRRRLLATIDAAIETYLQRRFSWLDAFSTPLPGTIREAIGVLAEAVERDEPAHYVKYAAISARHLVEQGVPPITVLVMADLLYEAILHQLTPEQGALVTSVTEAARLHCQTLMFHLVIEQEQKGA
ncbi:MAG: hypothetical protein ACR2JC_06775 [Chloroflexota bacterium]|nr:MAG: hypothetical protein DLM70_10310 [Chloroflexota bacterium]